MSVFEVMAMLLPLTALFSYANYRFIKLPITIGVMLIALVGSLTLISLPTFWVRHRDDGRPGAQGAGF